MEIVNKYLNKWKNLKSDTKEGIGLFLLGGAIFSYVYWPNFANQIMMEVSPKLKTMSEIENIVDQEKDYHKFNRDIEIRLNNKRINRAIFENGKDVIMLNKSTLCKFVVRHEVYHVVKSDTKKFNGVSYLFKDEPSASAYSIAREVKDMLRD
jgi:hypothetical protein